VLQQQQETRVSSMTANLRSLLLFTFLLLIHKSSAQLLADGLTEKLASLEKQQHKTVDQLSLAHTEAAAPSPAAAATSAEQVHDYELHGIAQQHGKSKGSYDKECPAGCERHGNCNRALGR
jgi:hypothetical protein